MKTTLYLDDKKITRKAAAELVGEERLKVMLKESKETFMEDPLIETSYWTVSTHMDTYCRTHMSLLGFYHMDYFT